jgi:CheY-like chemotaxis protein
MARILLAGSDSASIQTLAAEVMGEGHEARIATDGQEAYELALETLPDLVVLETALPVFNGFETCQMLRSDPSIPPTLPVVLLSSEEPDRRQMERVGATESLAKVHLAADLRELLSRLLPTDAY